MAINGYEPEPEKGTVSENNPPLIVHVIHRLQMGGLENGLVNLINRMPKDKYRHVIVAMTDYTDFSERLTRDDVEIFALHKKAGKDFRVFVRLWKLLRQLRPDIVHTRNLSALEASLVAVLSGVKYRVHGEHGRDVHDIAGKNWKYNLLRRFCQPFIQRYITVSKDLRLWLIETVRIPAGKITQIYNGVDSQKFNPEGSVIELEAGFLPENGILIGTVGRMETVKDQLNLAKAFVELIQVNPEYKKYLRLALIGDGSLIPQIQTIIDEAGLRQYVWFAGASDDVANVMRSLDIFVLPSLAEGISNTILEAMSCSLPVIATDVGGNPELVIEAETGKLVSKSNPQELAAAIKTYIEDPELMKQHAIGGRKRIEQAFSMEAMVKNYVSVYDSLTAD